MKRKPIKTKLLTSLLALCMVLSLVPITAFAAGAANEGEANENVIKNVDIVDATLTYNAGDAPKATAQKSDEAAAHYEIEEGWSKLQKGSQGYNEPVASWSSNSSMNDYYSSKGQLLESFEEGPQYMYSVDLRAKEGWTFALTESGAPAVTVTLNGDSVVSVVPFDDTHIKATVLKTFGSAQPSVETIDSISVENAKLSYEPGEHPVASATISAGDADKYIIATEKWNKSDSFKVVATWYSNENFYKNGESRFDTFEKGLWYYYYIYLEAKDGFTFDPDLAADQITLNGKSLPDESYVNVTIEGKEAYICVITELRPGKAVDVIEINDATVSFKGGDKPAFTGKVPEGAPYFIDYEAWSTDDEFLSTSEYWNTAFVDRGWCSGLISSFKPGSEYTYMLYLKLTDEAAQSGYYFDQEKTKLKVNGQIMDIPAQSINIDEETAWFSAVLTMTPEASASHEHSYGTEWKYDETNHWHECECGEKADLAAHSFVWKIDKEATKTETGLKHEECSVCGFKRSENTVIDKLPGGGETTEPTDPGKEKPNTGTDNPKTGDNSNLALWFVLMGVGAAGLGGALILPRKRRSRG